MSPFRKAGYSSSEIDATIESMLVQWRSGAFTFPDGSQPPADEHDARCMFRDLVMQALAGETYLNDTYQVVIVDAKVLAEDFPPMWHLSIKRLDKGPIHDWRDLQKIKNELVGAENEGMELYPAESRLVDSANQYHLFVFKSADIRCPFGFTSRYVDQTPFGKAKQRSFEA